MRSRILYILSFLFFIQGMWASPVSPQQARRKAQQTFVSIGGNPSDTASFHNIADAAGYDNLYIFSPSSGRGFVVLSTDDAAVSVLGYSAQNSFTLPIPSSVAAWIQSYDEQVAYLAASDTSTGYHFRPLRSPGASSYSIVGPLVQTRWNQSPFYNDSCPSIGGELTVTGCTATALAQIMRYWKSPITGTGGKNYFDAGSGQMLSANFGSTQYRWRNMPLSLSSASSDAEKAAVAQLMYHCGVSLSTTFGLNANGGSSAMPTAVLTALTQNFSFREGLSLKRYEDNSSTWTQLLKDEIDAGRPVFYAGYDDDAGHAFICDGYDNLGAFLFNWGWGGSYDGYFQIGALNPGGGGIGSNNSNTFNQDNLAIVGIRPLSHGFVVTPSATELSRWGDTIDCWVVSSSHSSENWHVYAPHDYPWLSFSSYEGAGSGTMTKIRIFARHNTSGSSRTGQVVFSHDGVYDTLLLYQPDGTPSPEGCYGNNISTPTHINIMANGQVIVRPEAIGNFATGYRVYQIQFRITQASKNFKIHIYEDGQLTERLQTSLGDYYDPSVLGSLVYTQDYYAANEGLQTVTLTTPYEITSGRDFWISIRAEEATRFYCNQTTTLSRQYMVTTLSTTNDTLFYFLLRENEYYDFDFQFCTEEYTPVCLGDTTMTRTTACDSFQWSANSETYSNSGTYIHRYSNAAGCPSIDTLYLTIDNASISSDTVTNCDSFYWRGNNLTSSDVYLDTVPPIGTNVCDSIYVLNLTIHQSSLTNDTLISCEAMPAHWSVNDSTYAVSTDDTASFLNQWHCDSLITLHFVLSGPQSSDTQAVTTSDTTWHNIYCATSGLYIDTMHNIFGCDSIVMLQLCIGGDCQYGDTVASECDSFVWYGTTYKNSTELAWHTLSNAASTGDSIVTLHLTIRHSSFSIDTHEACVSYRWPISGNTYGASNYSATWNLGSSNAVGCDSSIHLHLTIHQPNTGIDHQAACGSFTWVDGITYVEDNRTATYDTVNQWGCDSVATLHLALYDCASDWNVSESGCFGGNSRQRTLTLYAGDQLIVRPERFGHFATGGFLKSLKFETLDDNAAYPRSFTIKIYEDCFPDASLSTSGVTTDVNGVLGSLVFSQTYVADSFGLQEVHIAPSYAVKTGRTFWVAIEVSQQTYFSCDKVDGGMVPLTDYPVMDALPQDYLTVSISGGVPTLKYFYMMSGGTPSSVQQYGVDVNMQFCVSCDNDSTVFETICDNNFPYDWNGVNLTDAGTYTQTLTNVYGCDSIVTLHLSARNADTVSEHRLACDSLDWQGTYFYASLYDTLFLSNQAGCDSLLIRDFSIGYTSVDTVVDTACDSYVWNYVTYMSSLSRTDSLLSVQGCDSVATLYLTVYYSDRNVSYDTACDAFFWAETDSSYQQSTIDTARYLNQQKCDSLYVLNLTIHPTTEGIDTISACDSLIWVNGYTYYRDTLGIRHTHHGINQYGCDSIVSLSLSIHHVSDTTSQSVITCGSYHWDNDSIYVLSTIDTHTFANQYGCDSVSVLALQLLIRDSIVDDITACDSYTWLNGETYTSDTLLSLWFTNRYDCDSIRTLNLTMHHSSTFLDAHVECDIYKWPVNDKTYLSTYIDHETLVNAEGCDSLVTLHLTLGHTFEGTINDTVCDSLLWGDGNTYYADAIPTHTFITREGCDSTVTLNLKVYHSNTGTDLLTVCDSLLWIDSVTYYTDNDSATFTIANHHGCDSLVTLALTVAHPDSGIAVISECDSLTWIDGNTYAEDNDTATCHISTYLGCDSLVTLHLSLRHSSTGTDTHTVCDSLTWIDGHTYMRNTHTVTHTVANAQNCDSVVTLNLTVLHSDTVTETRDVCDSLLWRDGNIYTEDNDSALYTLTNRYGCNRYIVLNLSVRRSTTFIDAVTTCDSLLWMDGETYVENDSSATYTMSNAVGCDSLITLNLFLLHSAIVDSIHSACDSVLWSQTGLTYYESGLYDDTLTTSEGCDSIRRLSLAMHHTDSSIDYRTGCEIFIWSNGRGYTQDDDTSIRVLHNQYGCDSVVTLHLTLDHHTATPDIVSACDSFTWGDGITYAVDTTLTKTFSSRYGCDSTVTLTLSLRHSTSFTDYQHSCESFVWTNGREYLSSFTGTQTQTNAQGCDSLITLFLTLGHHNTDTVYQTVCDSLSWIGNRTYTTSGTIIDTLVNASGCDSVVVLFLTVKESSSSDFFDTACDTYVWAENGITYTDDDVATRVYTNAVGCDSLRTLHLKVYHSVVDTVRDTACDTYTWTNGRTYRNNNDSDTQAFHTVDGCDSTLLLNLIVYKSNRAIENQTVCRSFVWSDGNTYTNDTSVIDTFPNIYGCDSVVTLRLNVITSVSIPDTRTACDNFTWIRTGDIYIRDTTVHDTITNATACDSIYTLILYVKKSTTATDVQMACHHYVWMDSNVYYKDTVGAIHRMPNSAGCDSVVVLNLSIFQADVSRDTQVVCDTFFWTDGIAYTSSTVATQNLINVHGCDSLAMLYLTVNHSDSTIDSHEVCNTFSWHGDTYTYDTIGATRTLTNRYGCDSIATLALTVHYSDTVGDTHTVCDSYVWSNATTYTMSTNAVSQTLTNMFGCDSVVHLMLTVHYSDTVADTQIVCDSYTWSTGIIYTTSIDTTKTFVNQSGCDSVVSLSLTVNYSNFLTDTHIVCDTFVWTQHDGLTYTLSNYTARDSNLNIYGCDSIWALKLTVHHRDSVSDSLIACDSLRWRDGITYYDTCDTASVLLSNQYGCDSVIMLSLIMHKTDTTGDTNIACDNFLWIDSVTYTLDTVTSYTMDNQYGCDSVIMLVLTVNHSDTIRDTQQVCDTLLPYVWLDTSLSVAGLVEKNYTNMFGCDSVLTLQLDVEHCDPVCVDAYDTSLAIVCDYYFWGGTNILSSGLYTRTVHGAIFGLCDSIYTINVTVNYSSYDTISTDGCNSVYHDGIDYYSDTVLIDTFSTVAGCDSLELLYINVFHSRISIDTFSACDSILIDSTYYYSSSVLDSVLRDVNGCDSTYRRVLLVRQSSKGIYDTAVCDSVWYFKNDYTKSDTIFVGVEPYDTIINNYIELYTQTDTVLIHSGINSEGCDSATIVRLNISYSYLSITDTAVCDSLLWYGLRYDSTGVFDQSLNISSNTCDSTARLFLTVHYFSDGDTFARSCDSMVWYGAVLDSSDIYHHTLVDSNVYGCDSNLYLHLSIFASTEGDTLASACDSLSWYGMTISDTTTTYSYVMPNANAVRCDSTIYLRLTLLSSSSSDSFNNVCDTFRWFGTLLSSATDTHSHTLLNHQGCDSLITLHLTVRRSTVGVESGEACGYYLWHGFRLEESGEAYDTLFGANAVGCDSICRLYLTIDSQGVGSLNGVFEIDHDRRIAFSSGNLQYLPSAMQWRFAEHQYDYVGNVNGDVFDYYLGWIDLFGWATSGYHNPTDAYNQYYQPYSVESDRGYGPAAGGVAPDLTGISSNYDWGMYASISNGGNAAGQWRTLSTEEWQYLLYNRVDAFGKRALALVDSIPGLVLLPELWRLPDGCSFVSGVDTSYGTNNYTLTQWSLMEEAGAVFLPAAGMRIDSTVSFLGQTGHYWLSQHYGKHLAYAIGFTNFGVQIDSYERSTGFSVRLVKDVSGETLPCATFGDTCVLFSGRFVWHGMVYEQPGDYSYLMPNANSAGCDSTAVLHLATNPAEVGVRGIIENNARVWASGRSIVVADAEGQSLQVYDVAGRLILSESRVSSKQVSYPMSSAGVYMVKVGASVAHKVVIAR